MLRILRQILQSDYANSAHLRPVGTKWRALPGRIEVSSRMAEIA